MRIYSVNVGIGVRVSAVSTEKTLDIISDKSCDIIRDGYTSIDGRMSVFNEISSITELYYVVGAVDVFFAGCIFPSVDVDAGPFRKWSGVEYRRYGTP